MYYVIFIFGLVAIAFFTVSFFYEYDWIEIVGVTLITTYYHVCLRPLTGGFMNLKYHNNIDLIIGGLRSIKVKKLYTRY